MITKPKARKFRIRRSSPLIDSRTGQEIYEDDDSQEAVAESPAAPAPPPASAAPRPQPAAAAPAASVAPSRPDSARPTAAPASARPVSPTLATPRPAPQGASATRMAPPIPEDSEDAFALAGAAPMSGYVSSPAETESEEDLAAIRAEGLTGRQLRMARRVAQKHNIAATSDFDAVRQLRAAGIDPFQRSTVLDLALDSSDAPPPPPSGPAAAAAAPMRAQLPVKAETAKLPQTQSAKQTLPSTEVNPAERRAKEIMAIQRDIARRRRRRIALLVTRLSFFVFLPTLVVGYYFFAVATPMYATKAEFLILQADSAGGSGLGGLLTGTQFATNQDSIAVQSFLQSRDAMKKLDDDMGLKAHFASETIDPIQRLPENPSDEKAYKVFKKNVKIAYDPTEGVIKMEVVSADPQVSQAFTEHLITYAEERVDDLSKRKREDQMGEARVSLDKAKIERRKAQETLVALQEGTLLDPQGEIANIRSLISSVELQLQEKELALNSQLNNTRPNRAKVDALQTEVRLLSEELSRQNTRLNEATAGEDSLASKAAQIQMAQADLVTADLFLQSALQNEKQTELEANRQVRYLTTSVRPVAPDDPTYPRAFEDTVLAFLIFSGIYLMMSLTASILREQASS